MQLYYSATVSPGETGGINLPFGVKKCKLRCGKDSIAIIGIGPVASTAWSSMTDFEFPIVNGYSPCAFTTRNSGAESITINILVEELGGLPQPDYFTRG